MKKALIAIVAVVVLAAIGGGTWAAFGSDDETSARGTCATGAGTATYELSREDDDNSLEVTFELQSAGPGETWEVNVLQGDTPILTGARTTDEDGELDVDAPADAAAGTGFTVEATPADGETCTASLS